MKRRWRSLLWLLLPTLQLACGGKTLSYRTVSEDAGASTSAPLSPGGAGGMDSEGQAAGASAGDASTSAGGASTGNAACVTAADCGPPANRCAYATCIGGICASASVAPGLFLERDTPADCFDLVCDAKGQPVKVVDPDNVPKSAGPCLSNSCDAMGGVLSTPVPKGAACTGDNGAKRCDEAGRCVACLSALDCAAGQTCSAGGACATAACSDGRIDGDETDVDCGGSCVACAASRDCVADQDCASSACNAVAPHRCVASHCSDNHQDQDETYIDCGGSCPPCDAQFPCKVDADCKTGKCDTARNRNICLPSSCLNGVLDANETDVDCGGGLCTGCGVGKGCFSEIDCNSSACDAISLHCVADHCLDHALDGDETDIDCGGPTCPVCPLGGICRANTDCVTGLVCKGFIQRLCITP
jgi:hypothetical protein